mmetsp:Transcript_20490/g.56553  ORF Transcript_20490/g.56553 Transcript_20490/m.56553 type:complete len:121 (-) Transcript_20490:214-576(-)
MQFEKMDGSTIFMKANQAVNKQGTGDSASGIVRQSEQESFGLFSAKRRRRKRWQSQWSMQPSFAGSVVASRERERERLCAVAALCIMPLLCVVAMTCQRPTNPRKLQLPNTPKQIMVSVC